MQAERVATEEQWRREAAEAETQQLLSYLNG